MTHHFECSFSFIRSIFQGWKKGGKRSDRRRRRRRRCSTKKIRTHILARPGSGRREEMILRWRRQMMNKPVKQKSNGGSDEMVTTRTKGNYIQAFRWEDRLQNSEARENSRKGSRKAKREDDKDRADRKKQTDTGCSERAWGEPTLTECKLECASPKFGVYQTSFLERISK